jgi:hypothetical protein
MRTITVVDRQNIIDVAVQEYGSAASAFELCLDNGLELDSILTPGQQLLIQGSYPASADGNVADYLKANSVVVVSMSEESDGDILGTNDGSAIITNNGDFIGA